MEESSEESVSTVNGGYAEAARDALRIAAHLAGFWCLREIVFSIGRLNEAAYHSPVLVVEVARRFVQNHLYWCLPLIVLTLRGRLLAKWNTFEFQALSRWFSTALAFMLAAVSGGQAFNLYFNQEYAADRIVLLLLAALVAVRPIFILPFVILAIAIGGQFSFPMSGYQWQHHLLGVYRLPIHLLLVVFIGSVWRSAQAPDEDFHTHWWLHGRPMEISKRDFTGRDRKATLPLLPWKFFTVRTMRPAYLIS